MKDRIVFITGSSNGIGAETAAAFAREGAKLIITYHRDKKSAEVTAQRCRDAGAQQVIVMELDLLDEASIDQAVKKTVTMFGGLHILVNNAGVAVWKNLQEQTYDEIHAQIGTNLEGLIRITRAFVPFVKQAIINVGSGAGMQGYPQMTTYCATKFAVRGFTEALSQELPKHIVLCVNPGLTATRMTDFKGVAPEDVAQIILDTAKGKHKPESGTDVNVWDILPKKSA